MLERQWWITSASKVLSWTAGCVKVLTLEITCPIYNLFLRLSTTISEVEEQTRLSFILCSPSKVTEYSHMIASIRTLQEHAMTSIYVTAILVEELKCLTRTEKARREHQTIEHRTLIVTYRSGDVGTTHRSKNKRDQNFITSALD